MQSGGRPKMDKRRDLITGICMACISIFYLISTSSIKIFAGMGRSAINSTTIPRVWGVCLFILGILLIMRAMKEYKLGGKPENKINLLHMIKENSAVVYSFVIFGVYVAFLNIIGFIIMTALYLFFQMLVLTPHGEKKPLRAALLSVVFSLGIYYIFVKLLMIMLPIGILGF